VCYFEKRTPRGVCALVKDKNRGGEWISPPSGPSPATHLCAALGAKGGMACTPVAMPVGSSSRHGPRSAIALPLASPYAAPMPTSSASRLAASKHHSLRNGYASYPQISSSFWVGSGTARRYLQFLSANIPEAQRMLSVSVAIISIWNGLCSHPGLLHTAGRPCPLLIILNSSLCPPTTYHLSVEYTPTRPRHEP
jgi:hypothetical protein